MKFNISDSLKQKILFLIIPLSLGFLSFLLTKEGISYYSNYLIKPSFAPPSFLFFIVWTILYILMGVSSYIIYDSMSYHKSNCLILYGINLFFLFLWPLIFFNLKALLFAFIFILFLDIVVILMIYCFYGISKKAAILQIHYFLWLLFASVLNFSVYFLNR